ncbi:4Fe-4S binding protein [Clostridium celatum]|uniref:4Fe-4S dicluster domain-containing protein n=1 Tax=Clostridium celatum TaxID=36834 RepID=UPI0028FF5962|nr:4Fe-4S binding protein [Clostridium celatum]MDU2265674.1 4Fe-4S binding protein [Clostridium celatum]MDU6295667.1 4Fe-4S binding protein [Clostridium celatum]
MSHIVGKSAYKSLEERLNRFPQGAPSSDTLYKILEILFDKKEAELVAQLPIKPFSAEKAAKIWGMKIGEATKVLDKLSSKAILLDVEHDGKRTFIMPPPMAGFIEFSMMRTRGDIDQKLLAELYYQYLNVEEDFIKELFYSTETKLGRVYVQEAVLSNDSSVEILDYERASHIIKTASHIGISTCYCRHKMHHVGKGCDAPMDICMTFNNTAASLIKYEHARQVDASECLELLEVAYENNLVQCGENVRKGVNFICNCCSCCCEAMVAAKKFGVMHPVETTNFIAEVNKDTCVNCGKCIKKCPVGAIKSVVINKGTPMEKTIAEVDKDLCLGCGVCVRNCFNNSLLLKSRGKRIITPATSVHRVVLMAIEKGQLQDLIFDNRALSSHRAMAAILSSILKLSPVKKAMASKQMKSIYLDKLLDTK